MMFVFDGDIKTFSLDVQALATRVPISLSLVNRLSFVSARISELLDASGMLRNASPSSRRLGLTWITVS